MRKHPNSVRRGSSSPNTKFNERQVRKIKKQLRGGESVASIARANEVGETTIRRIRDGLTWSHVRVKPD